MKILVSSDNRKMYVRDITADFHSQFGFIKKSDLKKKSGSIVITNKGVELKLLDTTFIDLYDKLKRAPQIIPRKDIGLIITETGIGKKSKVLDAGSGSGALCCFLANIVKEVITYEVREDHHNVVKENIKFFGLKNIKAYHKDIYQGIDEKNIDLLTLDVPEPWLVLPKAINAINPGGFIVSYSPCVPQVMDFVSAVRKEQCYAHVKTVELILREWDVVDRKVRPQTNMMGHTGFLTFVRRI